METQLLDGKAIAAEIKAEVRLHAEDLLRQGIRPGLAAVLVGDHPASRVYVSSKVKTCRELGLYSREVRLPAETSTDQLRAQIEVLNRDSDIDGILVQLPLPAAVDSAQILQTVDPTKDVDGFHPLNIGRLCSGEPGPAPCTPAGILEMLKRNGLPIRGKRAVVLGRSNIVGKPTAMLLLREHATVTLCHSQTRNLAEVCRQADILIAAIGRPAMVTAEYLQPGATVIDVGINNLDDREQILRLFGEQSVRLQEFASKGYTLVGDVHPGEAMGVAGHLTPVPGGVGPMTIAMLMWNTVQAAALRHGKKIS